MKTVILSLFCLLCFVAKAQDIIMKTDQSKLSVKVVEITSDEVKFNYFDRQKGPIYTLKKSDIVSIDYQDGVHETFTNLTAPAVSKIQDNSLKTSHQTSTNTVSEGKALQQVGLTGGLFYTTPMSTFGEAHGMGANVGLYFLGKRRKGGGLIEVDQLFFFNNAFTRFGLIALSGILRASESSKFYIGGGAGLGNVSSEVTTYDYVTKRNKTERVGSLGLGGKAFLGYGPFRLGALVPFLENGVYGGLITVGFVKSVF